MKSVEEIIDKIDSEIAEFRETIKQTNNLKGRNQAGTVNRCAHYIAALQHLRDWITADEKTGEGNDAG